MMRRILIAVVVASLVPAVAVGAGNEFKWCVDSSGTAPNFLCTSPAPCDNTTPFATIAEAVSAAAAAPDVSPGVRPDLQEICVGTPGVHSESVALDNSSGILGSTVALNFVDELSPTWCSPDGAGIDFDGFGGAAGFISRNLWWDESICGANDGTPLFDINNAGTAIFNVRALGGSGTFLLQTGSSSFGNLIEKVRVEGRAGAALDVQDSFSLWESELSSNAVPSGESLVASGAPLENNLYQSLLFGNILAGGGSLVTLPGGGESRSNVYAANVVLDSAPLFAIARPPIGESDRMTFRSDVLSRNRLLGAGATAAPSPIETGRTPDPGSAFSFCLPEGADNLLPSGRAIPTSSGLVGDAALVDFDGSGSSSPFVVDLEGCFVVDNDQGLAGAVLRGTGAGTATGLVLIHNTVAAQDAVVVEHQGTGDASVLLARNLFVSPPRLGVTTAIGSVEATMDQGVDVPAFYGDLSSLPGLTGPSPNPVNWGDGASFMDPSNVRALNECQRAQLVCPELQCPPQIPTPREWFCALDAAAEYIPTEPTWTAAALEWPWSTTFFDSPAQGAQYNAPGASGWFCEEREVPYDALNFKTGDGDGFTTLVDCDNESAAVVPSVPGAEGHNGSECWDVADDCYECPAGSVLIDPPGDDDDSTAADDDDSGPADDDDSAVVQDDDDSGSVDDDDASDFVDQTVEPGCRPGIGCGVPIGVSWLPLPLLMVLRRRRTAPELPTART